VEWDFTIFIDNADVEWKELEGQRGRKIYFLSHSYMFKAFALHFPWVGIPLAACASPKLEGFPAR
jgi:hypothetical protein